MFTSAEIRQALQNGPPASFPVMKNRERWETIGRADVLQALTNEVREMAHQDADSAPPRLTYSLYRLFAETGDRTSYQEAYFERRRRMASLALSSLLENSEELIAPLEDMLWDICEEFTWSLPAHISSTQDISSVSATVDLMAAETAQALAEIAVWLEDSLSAELVRRIRYEVDRRVLRPAFEGPVPFHWEQATHNWAAVCAGAAGIAALMLVQDRARLERILNRVCGSMACFVSGYGNDGGCAEGLGYWVYGFGYYVYFGDLLYEYTDGRLDLLSQPKIAQIALFPERIHFADGVSANFSDSGEIEALPSGLLSRLSVRIQHRYSLPLTIPAFGEDPCYRWCHVSRNLLWTKEEALGRAQATESHYLPELAWLITRGILENSQGERLTAGLAVKGGHNDEPHNHNDLGHVTVHAGGENILCDLGAGVYTKAYFSDERDEIVNISSRYHSVPIINGQVQRSGRQAASTVLNVQHEPGSSSIALDLTAAYEVDGLQSYIRSLDWQCASATASLTIRDVFSYIGTAAPLEVEERFISCHRPEVAAGSICWTGSKAEVELTYDGEQSSVEVTPVAHLDHDGHPFTFYVTAITRCGVSGGNSSLKTATTNSDAADWTTQNQITPDQITPDQNALHRGALERNASSQSNQSNQPILKAEPDSSAYFASPDISVQPMVETWELNMAIRAIPAI